MIKETTVITQLRIALKTALPKIENMIEKREDYYDSRSEKWLESDKADEYQEDTENLQSLYDALLEADSAFEEVFEE